jgi:hypothetical protein
MSTGNERNPVDPLAGQARDDTDQDRRDAILRLAKYTAPAMLAMLLSDKAMAAGSFPSPD